MGLLTGKVAVITGTSSPKGIGYTIAKRFAVEGASLFLVARGHIPQMETAKKECLALGKENVGVEYGVFDLAECGAAETMVEKALNTFGRIDVLVNNAVARALHNFGDFSREEFDRIVAVNIAAPFFASQAVLPPMRRQGGGRIIHIASQLGSVAMTHRALYGMTKAALIYLTKAMAYELATEGIMVNAISPGPIMTDRALDRLKEDPETHRERVAYIPAGRFGEPEEIAEVALFLASTNATFLQGENIIIDGGYTIH